MTNRPTLFAGGTGVVGRATLEWFRSRHPDLPVLVAGRDMQAANEIVERVGNARTVAIDLARPRLGLDPDTEIGAVVMLAPDDWMHGLALAQDLGVPYLNIATGLTEIGPEVAMTLRRPHAAPIVLTSHWWGGPATFLALHAASTFESVRSVRLGSVIDDQDVAGPVALEDMERVHDNAPAAMAFQGGRRVWLSGESGRGFVTTIDGRDLAAEPFSTLDVASVQAATGAPDVRFDLVTGESSSRRRGDGVAAEIVVDVEGVRDGQATRSRSTLEFPPGLASLTGLSVVLTLSSVLGLRDGASSAPPGLLLPEQISDPAWILRELTAAGAVIHEDSTTQASH